MATGKDRVSANIANNMAPPNIGQQRWSGEAAKAGGEIGHLVVEVRRTNGYESKVAT